ANGKTCHQKIGRTVEITLDDARQRAKRLKAEITLGGNPQADRKARDAVITVDIFFQEHYLPHAKACNRGWKKKLQMYDLRIAKPFGHKRLDQIKRHDISSWHLGLREDGLSPAYSDRFLALFRNCLNKAVEYEMLEKNPAIGVKQFNIDNRIQRFLDDAELKRFLSVLATHKNRTVCLIVLFLLSTGARLGEALKVKWEDIDTVARVWRIPASNSKSKKIRSVPLNNSALAVVAQLDTEDKFDYLFINRKTGKPFTSIAKTFKQLTSLANLTHWTPHSCRHQYASFLVNSGRSLYEVQHCLGHASSATSERYSHLTSKSLRDAADSASNVIKAAMLKITSESDPVTVNRDGGER
ncbi:MAG: tyrosine-type recombinase/integrase, partial [bacterium]